MTTQLIFTDIDAKALYWLWVDEAGQILDRAEAARVAIAERVIVAVPASEILFRRLDLPGRSDAQDRAAALLALNDVIATPIETIHLALGPKPNLGSGTRQVAVVAKARLEGWLLALSSQGIKPDAVIADATLAPKNLSDLSQIANDVSLSGRQDIVVLAFDDRLLINSQDLVSACEPDLLVHMLGDTPANVVTNPHAVEEALAQGLHQEPLNLLQGAFGLNAPQGPSLKVLKPLMVLGLVALLVMPILGLGFTALKYHLAAMHLEGETQSLAKAALPEAKRIRKPLAQMKERVQALSASDRFLTTGAVLFTAIEPMEGVSVLRIVYNAEGDVWVSLSHPNAADLDRLEQVMSEHNAVLTREGSREDGDRQISDMTVRVN
jgi:general secretion pathway protein L